MSNTIILAGEASNEESMIRDIFLDHFCYVFTCMELAFQIRRITVMLHIAIMGPLCFCTGLPLGKPDCFPA